MTDLGLIQFGICFLNSFQNFLSTSWPKSNRKTFGNGNPRMHPRKKGDPVKVPFFV
jgi:hypothetical protein